MESGGICVTPETRGLLRGVGGGRGEALEGRGTRRAWGRDGVVRNTSACVGRDLDRSHAKRATRPAPPTRPSSLVPRPYCTVTLIELWTELSTTPLTAEVIVAFEPLPSRNRSV